jgi:signal transduction histidine kinase/DNA-binding response OmpR family regulator
MMRKETATPMLLLKNLPTVKNTGSYRASAVVVDRGIQVDMKGSESMATTGLKVETVTKLNVKNNRYRRKSLLASDSAGQNTNISSLEKIIVVEKDQSARAAIARVLLKMQYRVDCFENISEAIANSQGVKACLVIISIYQTELLDMMLAQFPPDTGVLIVADEEQMAAAAQSRCCNIRSFLVRPFTPRQLSDAVLHTIDGVNQIAESMRNSTLAEIENEHSFFPTSEDSFRQLLDTLMSHTDAAYASVLLKKAGMEEYSIHAEKGRGLPSWKRLCEDIVSIDDTVVYSEEDAPLEIAAQLAKHSVGCILSVPLVVGGEVRGIISQIKNLSSAPFKPSDVAYTSLLVRQFGLGLENTVLSEDVKNQQSYVQKLLTEISQAQTNERRRVATEIHDGVAQWLVGAALDISACHQLIGCNQFDDLGDSLLRVKETLQNSIRELRRAIADMRPELLIRLGLIDAITQSAENLKQEGIECSLNIEGNIPKLSSAIENNVYWIVQEMLSNIRKHADADRVNICVQNTDDIFAIIVVDNGRGFELSVTEASTLNLEHVGIMGMKERAELLGASLTISSTPGKGTTVSLKLPAGTKRLERENNGKDS